MAETDCVAAGWTLVEIGAMYPICVNNDCIDSLDIWQYVLSHFFLRTTFHQHLKMLANLNVIMQLNSVIICSSLTSHLSTVWAFHLQGTNKLLNGISFFCLKAFNTLPLAYTVCRTIMGGSRYENRYQKLV